MKIAVIITCFNRVETTLCCLNNLFACERPDDVYIDVWLVDDASPDGTGEKVKDLFPSVNVIEGTGKLYWCGGMRLAWGLAANAKVYDAFLLLNDDTCLFQSALLVFDQAIKTAEQTCDDAGIIVGAVCDPESGKTTYGASGNPARAPDGTLSPIFDETINCNATLVSRKTWSKLGGFRECFTHAMGDTDYGVRAVKNKIPVWLTPVHVGTCRKNTGPRWNDPKMPLIRRWKLLHSYKGCPPWEYIHLARMIHPWAWPLYMVSLYRRVLFPGNSAGKKFEINGEM
jgi:GT2 family glycosyltransferase